MYIKNIKYWFGTGDLIHIDECGNGFNSLEKKSYNQSL